MDRKQEEKTRWLAAQIRMKTIRCMESASGGHIGGAMSIADVLAVLYGGMMQYDPKNPKWEARDRLVVSKGHGGPAVYAALAISGFFHESELYTLNRGGTNLPSHCDRNKTSGIDMTTGSLGQGISCACGIAAALKVKKNPARVYIILGDGELQEGQVWEAVQFAVHHKLDNLTVLVDCNKRQLDGSLEEICKPLDLEEKFKAFGFYTAQVTGYDVAAVETGIRRCIVNAAGPGVVLLDTYKGIGCSFAEETKLNHFMTITKELADEAETEVLRRFEAGIVAKEGVYYV